MQRTTRLDLVSHFEGDIEKGAESVKLTPSAMGICIDKDQGITQVISNKKLREKKWPRVDKKSTLRLLLQI